ncbi:MAG: glycosyl hydrolase family 28-related protein [Opitutaceae bacterium]|nr:glycosyl hydrolase family 28-related protein [Opitutaceae bacterium]
MNSRFFRAPILLLGLLGIAAAAAAAPEYSQLWGEHGERWPGNGRLPDFSYAGYQRGEQPVPEVPQAANVKDFGAVGDGIADDTKAIQAAIDATTRGAVFVPAGRYKITDYVRITKSGIVLRGAGPGQTVFWFPHGLDEVHPRQGRTSTGSPASGYSFDGGFVSVQGDYQAERLAGIVAVASRGAREVKVDSAAGLAVGQNVLVSVREAPDHSLKTHLYCDDPGDIRRGKKLDTKMVMRILAVDGDRIRFDRPLRFATETAWQPEIRRFAPSVSESGIERIGFEFPGATYRGHFKENGANAIELRQVTNCWIRDVVIHNGDLGINIVACGNTVAGVLFTADPSRGRADGGVAHCTGHHAIQCKRAEDNLITRFEVRANYIHDLSVEHASGNVYSQGRGADVNFDHHKDTPYENLYTEIDCGSGSRVWRCGGGASIGRQCAGWGTFWNIRAARPIAPPPKGWGPVTMNFVGIASSQPAIIEPNGTWWEVFAGDGVHPQDLHAAQLERRMKATRLVSRAAAR